MLKNFLWRCCEDNSSSPGLKLRELLSHFGIFITCGTFIQVVYEDKQQFQQLGKLPAYDSLMQSFQYIALAVAISIVFSFMNVAIHQDEEQVGAKNEDGSSC